ncbi:MAG: type 2 isopentenyl-diphosphate Delta-isomerase [Desulfosarcina sp.]|nr:type 2 isopentenyl-diphosphate Delta-isomerase [Desulfosarcina sp.]MBC2744022.1 type 2 isopentenyl-diphosphate Delta-isomerase [Desulfosarcina sp.]MBC2766932.1 type 2 isopentenyl-diphosphate Delta-isomerase [Desulfosarcina sp.]
MKDKDDRDHVVSAGSRIFSNRSEEELQTSLRKSNHIKICLEQDVQFTKSNGFEMYELKHAPLPEIDLFQIDTSCTFCNKKFSAPFLIEAMTGGEPESYKINKNLAIAAQQCGIGMGLGSQRAMLLTPEFEYTYQVRNFAPDIFLMGNIGASQLKEFSVSEIKRIVEAVEADALAIHLNATQELCQPEGNTDWTGILLKIKEISANINLPVIVKETGSGLTADAVRALESSGIEGIDIGGAGGTSWAKVEHFRGSAAAERFLEWGLPTAESLVECAHAVDIPIIASGGIRNGIESVKAIALGACLIGMALPFLRPATISVQAVADKIESLKKELIRTMFLIGTQHLGEIDKRKLRPSFATIRTF